MNIFLSFLQSPVRHPIPAYDFWEFYMKNGIQEAGHSYSECPGADWALGLVPQSDDARDKWKADIWEKTIAWLKVHPADLFLSYLYPHQVDATAIAEIKKMGIPCVNFFCDNVREFRRAPSEFSVFDLNWVPEHKALPFYRHAGYAYINLPMPIWVPPALRMPQNETVSQVTFIGSKDIQRLLLFEDIVAKSPKLPLAIYGSGWDDSAGDIAATPPGYTAVKKIRHQYRFMKTHGPGAYVRKLSRRGMSLDPGIALQTKLRGPVSASQYNNLTAESMITIGVNRYPSFIHPLSRPDTYSRLRDIEAPMLGACYLTEWTAGIDELYDTGTEIETYRDADGFIEKVSALTRDESKRRILRLSGQKRALQDHGIPQSLERLLQKLC